MHRQSLGGLGGSKYSIRECRKLNVNGWRHGDQFHFEIRFYSFLIAKGILLKKVDPK